MSFFIGRNAITDSGGEDFAHHDKILTLLGVGGTFRGLLSVNRLSVIILRVLVFNISHFGFLRSIRLLFLSLRLKWVRLSYSGGFGGQLVYFDISARGLIAFLSSVQGLYTDLVLFAPESNARQSELKDQAENNLNDMQVLRRDSLGCPVGVNWGDSGCGESIWHERHLVRLQVVKLIIVFKERNSEQSGRFLWLSYVELDPARVGTKEQV